ncbi:hypothetical protein CYY_002800 [Polysphondylium violaceum]|uniref:EGF-like domain-containing protein n=1 Tax=Polysphondylium violaceum TaxID=133409 RepID=A0A8J4Q141_9MYCE|nr:hypothetical protein CYY_002800 [Polysphondylium violaceum]
MRKTNFGRLFVILYFVTILLSCKAEIQLVDSKPDPNGCVNSEYKVTAVFSGVPQFYQLSMSGTFKQVYQQNGTLVLDLNFKTAASTSSLSIGESYGPLIEFKFGPHTCSPTKLITVAFPSPLNQNRNWLFDSVAYYLNIVDSLPGQNFTVDTLSGPFAFDLKTTSNPRVYALYRTLTSTTVNRAEVEFDIVDILTRKVHVGLGSDFKSNPVSTVSDIKVYTGYASTLSYTIFITAASSDLILNCNTDGRPNPVYPHLVSILSTQYNYICTGTLDYNTLSGNVNVQLYSSGSDLTTLKQGLLSAVGSIQAPTKPTPTLNSYVINNTNGQFIISLHLNKQYLSYVPFKLTNLNVFSLPTSFPLGIIGGTPTLQTFDFTYLNPSAWNPSSYKIDINFGSSDIWYYQVPSNVNVPVDTTAPFIENISVLDVDSQSYKLIFHIIDKESGFHSFSLLSFPDVITFKHLVEGNVFNGIYETTISKLKPISLDFEGATAIDKTGNIFTIRNGYYSYDPIRKLSFSQTFLNPFEINTFQFNVTEIDNSSLQNTGVSLLLKFPMANPKIPVLFTLGPTWSNAEYSIENLKPFYYDSVLGGYKIEFNVPFLRFLNGYLPFTLYIQSVRYTHTEIQSVLGNSTQISIITSNINNPILLIPPAVNSYKLFSDPGNNEYGFEITTNIIISYYEITVTSKYNLVGFNFTGSPNGLTFKILFSPYCVDGDVYSVTYMKLVSNTGFYSSTLDPNAMNPLYGVSQMSCPITCSSIPNMDTTPPELVSFTVSKTNVNLESNDRVVDFIIRTQDSITPSSSTDTPTVYLFTIGHTLECKSILKSQEGSLLTFSCSIEIPQLLPTNNPIILSVYGYANQQYLYGGASTKMLMDQGFQSFISLSGSPFTPKITSSSITASGKELTIVGQNFGTFSQAIVQVDYGFGFNSISTFNRIGVNEIQLYSLETKSTISVRLIVLDTITNTVSHTISSCPGDCNGHGFCSQVCVCTPPWAGIDCLSTIITIPEPSVNTTTPIFNGNYTISDKDVLTSLVSIVSLREIDYTTQQAIHTFNFNTWIFKNLTEETGTKQYLYSTNISKADSNIVTWVNVTTRWFDVSSNITFAGQFLQMNPSTVKYNINISNYPFSSSLNYIQLVMSAVLDSSKSSDICSNKQFTNDTENSYIKLQLNEYALSGRFIERGILDGRVQRVTNTLLDSQLNPIASHSSAQSYIGINIGTYKQLAEIDPDFSVLVDSKSVSQDENSICIKSTKKPILTTAQIVGIAVGGGVFLFMIIAIIVWVAAKKGNSKMAIKLRNLAVK